MGMLRMITSTAAAAAARTALYSFGSTNPTCKLKSSCKPKSYMCLELTVIKGIWYLRASSLGMSFSHVALLIRYLRPRRSLEQHIGITAACMPALRQLTNIIKRKRNIQSPQSTEFFCSGGISDPNTSLEPSQKSPQSDSTGFTSPPLSPWKDQMERKDSAGTVRTWNPRPMDSPRFHRPSLTPDQAAALKEYHSLRADDAHDLWEDGRARGARDLSIFSTRPELGYTCRIEGGSPKQ